MSSNTDLGYNDTPFVSELMYCSRAAITFFNILGANPIFQISQTGFEVTGLCYNMKLHKYISSYANN